MKVVIVLLEDFDRLVHWRAFPANKLDTKYNLEGFKFNTTEFRPRDAQTAENTYRDIRRFRGCFEFDDSAGNDLNHLVVSIFEGGVIKRLIFTDLRQAKTNYVISLKVALKHFVPYLENEERVHRAFGSMTTALGNILKAFDGDLSTLVKSKKAAGREARAVKDTKNNEEWVGSDVWREMVLTSMQGLRCLHEHNGVPGCFTKNVHNLPNHFLSVINLSQLLSLAGVVGGN